MFCEERNNWLKSSDEDFIKNCKLDWFQASGPGGQKRNRKYSGVRLHHLPTKIAVEEVHSRSQNENKHNAIKKLKLYIAIETEGPEIGNFRYDVSISSYEYPLFVAKVFDVLKNNDFSISSSAEDLKLTTSKLIKILSKNEFLWREVNIMREKLGLKNLKV